MKKILFKFFIINILLFVASCSTSKGLNLNSHIQKKRYSNGYYISSFKNLKRYKSETEVSQNKIDKEVEIINQNIDNSTYASIENELNPILIPFENQINNNKIDSFGIRNQSYYVSEKLNNSIINNISENKISNQTEQELRFDKKSLKSYLSLNYKTNNNEKLLTILFFVLALILPPLSVLLYTNIDWKKVLIATILTCLWWGPGVLYAILVLLEIL